MTPSEYREKFGADFKKHEGEPWFVALMRTLSDSHPLRRLKTKKDGDKLAGATIYLGEIDGYEQAVQVFDEISTEPTKEAEEPTSDYSTPPDI